MRRGGTAGHLAAAALPFAVSRALVWLGTEAGAFISQGGVNPRTQPGDFFHWDALRYQAIWLHGYHDTVTAAFFPLFPYLVRGLGSVVGEPVAALLIPNLAFGIALALFHAEAASVFDRRRAGLATWALALWPWSVFFSYPYTESLFLLLTVGAFRLVGHRRWLLAGLAGALAAATRFPGILLAFAFGAEAWANRRLVGPLLAAVLTPLGLILFALLLWHDLRDPLAFWHGQETFVGPPRNPLFPVGEVVDMFRQQNPFKAESLGLPVLAAFAAAAVWVWRRLPLRYGAYTAVTVALFAYQGYHLRQYHSVPRYLLADFACFFAFGAFLARHDRWQIPWTALSAMLMTVEAALYGSGHFIG